jgi:hypothetical protein
MILTILILMIMYKHHIYAKLQIIFVYSLLKKQHLHYSPTKWEPTRIGYLKQGAKMAAQS